MVLKTSAGRASTLRQRSTSWQKSPSNSNPRRRQSAHKTLAVRSPAICAQDTCRPLAGNLRGNTCRPLVALAAFALLHWRPCSSTAAWPAVSSRCCRIGTSARSCFPMALRHGAPPASSPQRPGHHLPDGAPPRRPGQHLPWPAAPPRRLASTCPGQQLHLDAWPVFTAPRQQQTSFGGEKHSGLASNLAHLSRIC